MHKATIHHTRMSTHLIYETGFANIWKATDKKGASVWIDGWKTRDVLTHLFQVLQVPFLPLHNGTHALKQTKKKKKSAFTKTYS